LRTILLLASLFLAGSSTHAEGELPKQPKLIAGSEILVDPNTDKGSELITLRVDGGTELEVSLSAVISPRVPGAKITFKAENDAKGDGTSNYSTKIPAKGVTKVWLIVTGATTAGEFELDIRNDGTSFDKTIKVVRLPFEVKLSETNPKKFSMVAGVPVSINLKNDDPVSYPLIWKLSIDGQDVCSEQFTLAANGVGPFAEEPE